MKKEMSWLSGKAAFPDDQLSIGSVTHLPIDHRYPHDPLEKALSMEQMDEDRRISTGGAFLMFMFGFGCGAFWTILLTWLL